MEHDTSTLRLILRNTEQRAATARAAIQLGSGSLPDLDGTLPFPVDGDTLAHMRGLTRSGRRGYSFAASDANVSLYPLRETLRDNGEAVA